MKFKFRTIDKLSLDAPKKIKDRFLKKADIIIDNDIINLSFMQTGETIKAMAIFPENNFMALNIYKRIA
jgi:hypothetical protein